jgi:anti-sigma B factor antagonist
MGEDSNIGIDISARGDALVVRVDGEVDLWTAHRFEEALSRARTSSAPTIVVDLERVTFMDSAGVHVLVQSAVADGMRRRLTVTRGSPQVRRLFEVSGVGRYLSFAPAP